MSEAPAFGRYRVTGPLGAGGMGEVHAAVDEVLGREVAVKTLRNKTSGFAAHMLDERFRQEARAIAQLSHPGVVQVFDIDLAADPPYIVMERVAGPSLKERLTGGRLEVVELRSLGIQVSRALAAAHAAGILHRDVKPANILSASGGMWKLADFGVAHVPDSALTLTGQFVGSPAYAPPEALVNGQSAAAGDIYGLGATLYEAALGRWPRITQSIGALFSPLPKLASLAPHVPTELADAIDRAVAVAPESRPTAAELADLIAHASNDSVSVPGAATPVVPIPSANPGAVASATSNPSITPIRWKPIVAVVLGIVVLVAIVAVAARGSSSTTPSSLTTPAERPPAPREPGEIRAVAPEITRDDRRAQKSWGKILDKLGKNDWSEALHKLSDFERKHGESVETRELREQLEKMPRTRTRED